MRFFLSLALVPVCAIAGGQLQFKLRAPPHVRRGRTDIAKAALATLATTNQKVILGLTAA